METYSALVTRSQLRSALARLVSERAIYKSLPYPVNLKQGGVNPQYSWSFCCKRGYAAVTGSLAVQPFDIRREYASELHDSECPSRFASARFRNEPSWIMRAKAEAESYVFC